MLQTERHQTPKLPKVQSKLTIYTSEPNWLSIA